MEVVLSDELRGGNNVKIKISNLNKLINALSGRELDLYLYLIKRQNSIGSVTNVFYRDAMEDLRMPKSTFYVCMNELFEKGFLTFQDTKSGAGYDVFLLDNSFINESDFKEGYLNINLDYILSEEFINLKVNIKKFLLRLLSLRAGERNVKLLRDTLRGYKVEYLMDELAELFHITVDGDGYMFKVKDRILTNRRNSLYLHYENKVRNFCRCNDVEFTEDTLTDTVVSISNQINTNYKEARVLKALDEIRRIGSLQPKLINFICGSGVNPSHAA